MSAQNSNQSKFNSCLIVSRHELINAQKSDLNVICNKYTVIEQLPTDVKQLKELVAPYDAIVASLPVNLYQTLLSQNKAVLTWNIEALAVAKDEDLQVKLSQLNVPSDLLIISKAGANDPVRISRYKGISRIVRIVIEQSPIISH